MQNKRIVVLVVLVIAAALLLGYLIGRAPSLGTPVAAVEKPAAKPSNVSESDALSRKAVTPVPTASMPKKRAQAPDAPTLKSVYADLKRRADANDANAATELFRDLSRCHMEQELSSATRG